MDFFENESKKLRTPSDRKAIRRNLYNGEIYLDKEIKIQSIGFCHTDQTFFITLGMKESPDSLRFVLIKSLTMTVLQPGNHTSCNNLDRIIRFIISDLF